MRRTMMGDPGARIEREPAPGTHCEWCGAEYGESPQASEKPRPAARRPAADPVEEPATHCEWCGAEYPLPDEER